MNNTYYNNPDHDYDKRTPLINFISNIGHTIFLDNDGINRQVLKIIEKNRNSINEREAFRDSTPLHWAIFKRKIPLIRLLLENGADVNARDDRYNHASTPIHWAVTDPPSLELVKLLLEFNADISITNSGGGTPMDTVRVNLDNRDIFKRIEYNKILKILEKYNNNPEFTESEFLKYYSNTHECYICYEPLADGTPVCVNTNKECRHGFHCRCIKPWLRSHDTCPVCKQKFLISQLGEFQQRALQNSFGKKRSKLGIKQLNAFKKYLDSL